jgi:ActR/RegA family two-component response regulator
METKKREIKNKNFILVDDEMYKYAERIKDSLIRYGITPEVAEGYDDALEKMKTIKFGLAIIDISLGDGKPDGLQLIRKIRETDQDMVIYTLTGYGAEKEQPAMEAGADKLYFKPFYLKEYVLKPMGVIT